MKVTALIPDELMERVTKLAAEDTTTDSLIKALREWVSIKELSSITAKVRKKPLRFSDPEISSKLRQVNRRTT